MTTNIHKQMIQKCVDTFAMDFFFIYFIDFIDFILFILLIY